MEKFKKFTSLLISASLFLQASNPNVFADGDDPTDSTIIGAVKEHFKAQDKDFDGSFKSITYPKDRIDGKSEESMFVLEDGKSKMLSTIIDPKHYKDYRMMKFYNIPALLTENKKVTSSHHGAPTGNIPLKLMVNMYLTGMKNANDILNSLKYMGFEEKMVALSKEFNSRILTDPELMRNVSELAGRIGASESDARQAYALLIISENMAKELAKNADSQKRISENVKYALNKFWGNSIVGVASSTAVGGTFGGVGSAVGMAVGSVIFPGVGTAVGWFLGAALATALSIVPAYIIASTSKNAKRRAEESDRKFIKDIHGSIDASVAHLSEERALNYASLLRQMMHFMNQEPAKVMDSNIFITAVDHRNFIDSESLKKSKDYNSAFKLMATPNQGAWCDFKYIPELENAPCAKDYRTKDGRCMRYLIDIFKAACTEGKIDFDRLKHYADGSALPINLRAVSTSIVDSIKEYIELGATSEKIVEFVMRKDKSISREEILQIVERETVALQTQSK